MNCPNHPETAADQTCTRCRKTFCSSCVVTLGDQTLCAPCKEERVRELKSGVAPVGEPEPEFFPISLTRLAVMSIATFGFYEVIWFYQQWKWIKRRDNRNLSPLARAIFGLFFMYPLFEDVNEHASKHQGIPRVASRWLTAAWLICWFVSLSPGFSSLFSAASILALLPAQRSMNLINAQAAPEHDRNARFSAGNIVTLAISALCWLGVIMFFVRLAAIK